MTSRLRASAHKNKPQLLEYGFVKVWVKRITATMLYAERVRQAQIAGLTVEAHDELTEEEQQIYSGKALYAIAVDSIEPCTLELEDGSSIEFQQDAPPDGDASVYSCMGEELVCADKFLIESIRNFAAIQSNFLEATEAADAGN